MTGGARTAAVDLRTTHVQFLCRARKRSAVSRPPELCRPAAQERDSLGPTDLSRPRPRKGATGERSLSRDRRRIWNGRAVRTTSRDKVSPENPVPALHRCATRGALSLACRSWLACAAPSLLRRLVGRSQRWPRQRPRIRASGTPQGGLSQRFTAPGGGGCRGRRSLLPLHSDPPLAAAGGCAGPSVLN